MRHALHGQGTTKTSPTYSAFQKNALKTGDPIGIICVAIGICNQFVQGDAASEMPRMPYCHTILKRSPPCP